MEYFKILDLKKEPFSNSPDPELFYRSRNHVEGLQMIEMAIRLRRGLNVVLGEVGTGKTTMCRKLIQQISSTSAANEIEIHLILDPSFSSPREFLSIITGELGLSLPDNTMSEWQMKENIKKSLFDKGVEEGKTVALLIDEGQKLPGFCLEILREFLNYETNDSKLLQIVIFAQKEFREKINEQKNFANRINLCYSLPPLGLIGTSRMVSYRLSQTSGNGTVPHLFTYPGLLALYLYTGGYPRSINMLCHHVILTLLIQNRVKAGWSLVRSCAGRHDIKRNTRTRYPVLAFVILLLVMSFLFIAPAYNKPALITYPVKNELPKPFVLGQLPIEKEESPWQIFRRLYHSEDPDIFKVFIKANPQIEKIELVNAGDVVTIPAVTVPRETITQKVWVQVALAKTLSEAYSLLKTHSGSEYEVKLLPFWNKRDGLTFTLLLNEPFPDRKAAVEAVNRLSSPMLQQSRPIETWDDDTVFYYKIGDRS